MTHFKVDIQLPINFNPEKGEKKGKKIPEELFFKTYEDLLKLASGISTSENPIIGSWIHPKTQQRFNDKSTVFTVLVESEDKKTITNVPKIQKLIEFKKVLKNRFIQYEIFMIATRCTWI